MNVSIFKWTNYISSSLSLMISFYYFSGVQWDAFDSESLAKIACVVALLCIHLSSVVIHITNRKNVDNLVVVESKELV